VCLHVPLFLRVSAAERRLRECQLDASRAAWCQFPDLLDSGGKNCPRLACYLRFSGIAVLNSPWSGDKGGPGGRYKNFDATTPEARRRLRMAMC
jgi:hypothetical protein